MVTGDDSNVLKLKDATITRINKKVNLIGVILAFGLPRKSKGSDYFCNLRIIDESHKEGIQVRVFTENMEMLPFIASPGDIIQLRHVKMEIYKNEACAIFNKRFSSFALYEGKDGQHFLPYQASARFSHREQDNNLISGLRNWLDNLDLSEGSVENFSLLSGIKEDQVNLACKVLHLCEFGDEWAVFLWDGTDAPPTVVTRKLEDEKDNQLPLHLEPPLSRDVLCTFPAVGTILRVIIKPDHKEGVDRFLEIGKWVKLLNVICEVNAGLWRGMLISSTMLQYVPKEDAVVEGRLRMFNKRLSSSRIHGRMPLWSFPLPSPVTEVDHHDVAFCTLMDAVAHTEVTAKFKCVVRFLAAFPWRVEDFRSPHGVYRIRFTLEDPTARIHAFVYNEDGETFFDGYPSTDVLRVKRKSLLGIATATDDEGKERNPPWVQCCLKSYYLDKNKPWETRQFRIFDTKVIG